MHEGGCLYGCVREAVTDQLQQFYSKLRISLTIVWHTSVQVSLRTV